MRGRFITFEGGEGAGKSTQVKLLAQRLRAHGHDVVVTREPGGSPGAEAMRHIILSGAAKPLGPDTEAILFAAARSDHVMSVIEPALAAGRWVLCDRFADSTRAYQGMLGNVDMRLIGALERIAIDRTPPDLTLILDLPPEIGLARAAVRRGADEVDRFEAESIEFHRRLREAYRQIAEQSPYRCHIVDAAGDPEQVAEAVWQLVVGRFEETAPETPARAVGGS